MNNILVSSEANNLVPSSLLASPSNYPVHLEAFDLDEALAAAEESRRRYLASKWFMSNSPAVHNKDDDACPVCMERFDRLKSDDQGNKRIPCGHVYHTACITTWLCHCNSCPLCRCDIISLQY